MSNVGPHSAQDSRVIARPPQLHWTVVLVLAIVTRLLFEPIWLAVQAHWLRKVTGRRRAFTWTIVNLCLLPLFLLLLVVIPQVLIGYLGMPRRYVGPLTYSYMLSGCLYTLFFSGVTGYLLAAATSTVTAFVLRSELRAEPINLKLGGLKTFFFGPIYFQYFLDDLPVRDA